MIGLSERLVGSSESIISPSGGMLRVL